MEKHDYLELIQKYFRDELSHEDQLVFEQLQSSPDFQKQLAEFEFMHDLLEMGAILEEAAKLDFDHAIEAAETEPEKPGKPIVPLYTEETTIKMAIVDDHRLFRKGIIELVNGFIKCKVILEAENGQDFINKLNPSSPPDIVLLDINMPIMDGYETAYWLNQHHPEIKVLVLSMYDHEEAVMKMLRSGVRGYVTKDADPAGLREAINTVAAKGFYYSDPISEVLAYNTSPDKEKNLKPGALSKREIEFLELVCTEFNYKEIANQMSLSLRTIEGYREALFRKLRVKSRQGLILYSIKHGIVPTESILTQE